MGHSTSPAAFLKWLEIREANGHFLSNAQQLSIDADHSALLRRLLEGRKVYPEAPPLAFSYPWYELFDNDKASPMEVFVADTSVFPKDTLIIDQSAEWRILEKLNDTSWIATYQTVDVEALAKIRSTFNGIDHIRKGILEVPKKLSTSRWKVYYAGPMPQLPEKPLWWVERLQ